MPGTLNNEHAAPYTNGTKMKADGTPCDGTEFYLDILGKELEAGVGDPNGISIGQLLELAGRYPLRRQYAGRTGKDGLSG